MRVIDQLDWPRKEHFQLYSGFEFPHVNICVQLDITELWENRSQVGASPTIILIYVITKAANRVPELRQRIRGEEIIEHEIIHPLITVLGDNDLFGVVTLTYDAHFTAFASNAAESLAKAKEGISMNEFPHDQEGRFARDDLLSITILPWLAFTGFFYCAETFNRLHSSPGNWKSAEEWRSLFVTVLRQFSSCVGGWVTCRPASQIYRRRSA